MPIIVWFTFGICITDTNRIIDEASTQNEHYTEGIAIDDAVAETLHESQIRISWNREEFLQLITFYKEYEDNLNQQQCKMIKCGKKLVKNIENSLLRAV